MKNYLEVPTILRLSEIGAKGAISPGMFQGVHLPNKKCSSLISLLDPDFPYIKGIEPGSRSYIRKGEYRLLRTRSLREHSYVIYDYGDSSVPIHKSAFVDYSLTDSDIIMSKDSNVGEVALIAGDDGKNCVPSGGLLKLNPGDVDRFYLFAFLKHPIFKTQLLAKVPKGATIKHAGDLWMECLIPFPSGKAADKVVQQVSDLTKAIFLREKRILELGREIFNMLLSELELELDDDNSSTRVSLRQIEASSRLDTGLYSKRHLGLMERIHAYRHGVDTLENMGITNRRGPNLAVSVIGKAIYGTIPIPGWYQLIRPVSISEHGYIIEEEYLGTLVNLPTLKKGDMIFGSEATFRSMVVESDISRCTTNFHGTTLSWKGAAIEDMYWLRCVFDFYRQIELFEGIAVGGQGGHLSPEYFSYIPIPRMPKEVRNLISAKYGSHKQRPIIALKSASDIRASMTIDANAGILDLNKEVEILRKALMAIQSRIIEGEVFDRSI